MSITELQSFHEELLKHVQSYLILVQRVLERRLRKTGSKPKMQRRDRETRGGLRLEGWRVLEEDGGVKNPS